MEQILKSGYLEMGTQFSKKKMEAFLVIFMSLCVLWFYVQSTGMNEIGTSDRNAGVDMALGEDSQMLKNEIIMETQTDWLPENAGMVLDRPIKELEWKVDVSQPESKLQSLVISENHGAAVQEITAANDLTESKTETGELAAENGNTLEDSQEIVPAVLTYRFFGNGGMPETTEMTFDTGAVTEEGWPVPERNGKIFDGWYEDPACTIPYSGVSEGREVTELYAGWKDFANFICDDRGYIISCTCADAVSDGILVLPAESACKGIAAGAFEGMEDQITDIYIPGNIQYIDQDAFSNLGNLMYIEVDRNNPNYYSENGVLYSADGDRIACPCWYTDVE